MNLFKKAQHFIPLMAALIALIPIFLAPFWAYQWYQQPFIGAFLEANNVVSLIGRADWPALQAGVQWPDRLLLIDGIPVQTEKDLSVVLSDEGTSPLILTMEQRDRSRYEVVVTPRKLRLDELAELFVIPYVVGLAFLATGLWAYWFGGKGQPARAFLLFSAATSVASVSFLDMNTTHYFLSGWTLSLPVAAGGLIFLAFTFPQRMVFIRRMVFLDRYLKAHFLPWILTILAAALSIKAILLPVDPWAYIATWRINYGYSAAAIVYFLGSLLVRIYSSHSSIIRQQCRIIIFGAAVAFAPILVFYFIPMALGQVHAFQIVLYLPTLVILPLSVAYAIVRYRLLVIDRVLSKVVAYGLITTSALIAFYLLVTLLSLFLEKSLNTNEPFVIAIYLLLLVLFLRPFQDLVQRAIDRLFYRSRADYRHVLSNLSRGLVTSPNYGRTLQVLEKELNNALNPDRLLFYLYDDDHQIYRPQSPSSPLDIYLPPRNPLVRLINKNQEATWFHPESLTDLDNIDNHPTDALYPRLPTHNLAVQTTPGARVEPLQVAAALECLVFVPLRYEGRLSGFLALGARRSGDPYSSDDLEFLSAVADQSALAIENARLFNNLQRTLDETLEMKNLMDDIFASIPSAVITTNLERQITLFNQAAEQILRLRARQVVGYDLPKALSDVGPELDVAVRATISQGTTTLGQEISPVLSDRGQVALRFSTTPLRDARLRTKGATILIDDLTAQRHLEVEQERIRQTFGRVVAPRVRDRLLADPGNLRLDGIRQDITVLFADMHKFTPFSERTPPDKVLAVLNSYISLAAQAVLDEEGTLDKFIGDAVMAFWNAPDTQPDHTMRAIRAALAMDQAIKAHRSGLDTPFQLYFSIGITRGEAMVGNLGTPQLFNYTAIGDTVNLAQRLESIATPGQILLSEETYRIVADQVIALPLPPQQMKGREQEVVVYELQGLKGF